MDLATQLPVWALRLTTLALFTMSAAPFFHTGWWVARICDFPRLQLAAVAVLLIVAAVVAAIAGLWGREPWFWAAIAASIAAWQVSHILPFTPAWPRPVAHAVSPNLSMVVANVDFRNDNRAAALRSLEDIDADVYLLIEIDEAWKAALAPLRDARPHRAEYIAGDGLGLVVWSRFPLTDTQIEFLVSEHRPSIHTTLTVGGRPLQLVALHPTPPGLPIEGTPGRHDSRIRDAELLLVADRVAQHRHTRWIVAGDFNDVAWSRTTRLFQRRSGLLDPRIGRGLINTYHTRYPPLRYPLDHVFVSAGFRVGTFDRFRVEGSDHFAVRVELSVPEAPAGLALRDDAAPNAAAHEIVEEGLEDAAATDRVK